MPKAWSDKRERQYAHIKDSLEARGRSERTAEEIAARTVNKERAQRGEGRTASRTSLQDTPASVQGSQRSHTDEGGRTLAQLRQEASAKKLPGRSGMNKAELERALAREA